MYTQGRGTNLEELYTAFGAPIALSRRALTFANSPWEATPDGLRQLFGPHERVLDPTFDEQI